MLCKAENLNQRKGIKFQEETIISVIFSLPMTINRGHKNMVNDCKRIFDTFCHWSGGEINLKKSDLLFSKRVRGSNKSIT